MNKSKHIWQCCLLLMHITSLNYSGEKMFLFRGLPALKKSNPVTEHIKIDGVKIESKKAETFVGCRTWQRGKYRWALQPNIN